MKACRKIGYGPALNGKQDHRLDGSERVVKARACEDGNVRRQSPFPRAWGQSPFPRVSLTLAGFVCVLRRQKSKYKRFMFMG